MIVYCNVANFKIVCKTTYFLVRLNVAPQSLAELIAGSPRLAPLTFHMIRSCLLLSGPDFAFVPLWSQILEILSHIPAGKGMAHIIYGIRIKNIQVFAT